MALVKNLKKVVGKFMKFGYFASYRDADKAYIGHKQYIWGYANATTTANVAVGIRASTSGYVALPGSTTGLGSNASFMYSPHVYIGVPKDTIEAASEGWYQIGGTATIYIGTGTTLAAGGNLQMLTASKIANVTALAAAYTGLNYQVAIAQVAVAVGSVPATYCAVMLTPTQKQCLLTT